VNKSPSKIPDTLSVGGPGHLGIPGGKDHLKMTRSVSRGRPTTTSNTLSQKVNNNPSPSGHKK